MQKLHLLFGVMWTQMRTMLQCNAPSEQSCTSCTISQTIYIYIYNYACQENSLLQIKTMAIMVNLIKKGWQNKLAQVCAFSILGFLWIWNPNQSRISLNKARCGYWIQIKFLMNITIVFIWFARETCKIRNKQTSHTIWCISITSRSHCIKFVNGC